MIKYSKRAFTISVSILSIIALIIVGLLYTNGMIGEISIPYLYLLGSFFVTTILFDPFEYLNIFKKRKKMKEDNYNDIDSISVKYMTFMTLIILIVSSIIFFGVYLQSGFFYGIFSVIYILTVTMTIFYNLSFIIARR